MSWVLSDNPNDWASQVGALATGAGALFTGLYVWFTYRLVSATAETAAVALHEARYQRVARILPAQLLLDDIGDRLNVLALTSEIGSIELLTMSAAFNSFIHDIHAQMLVARTVSPAV